jgi:hypothetical protein
MSKPKKHKNFQKWLSDNLASGKLAYADAPIYTILYDLCEKNSIEEVFQMLHNVATDQGKRQELESMFEEAKKFEWPEQF